MPEDTSGFFVRRVLESPWPTVIVLGLLAAVLVWISLDREDRRLLIAGAVSAVLAVSIGVIGTLVQTDR